MERSKVKEKYNKDVVDKFDGEYEHARWFKDATQKAQHAMTHDAIERHLLDKNITPQTILELGSGEGTWTTMLREKYPSAQIDLVDISREMLELAKKKLGEKNINYLEYDFLQFSPNKKYDLFFSSRAIEYIPEKEEMVCQIFSLINSGGAGFILTKTPHYKRAKMRGRKFSPFHQGQIAPAALMQLLRSCGAEEVTAHPVTISFPLIRSPKLNLVLYKIFSRLRLNFVSSFFSESYAIYFKKP